MHCISQKDKKNFGNIPLENILIKMNSFLLLPPPFICAQSHGGLLLLRGVLTPAGEILPLRGV